VNRLFPQPVQPVSVRIRNWKMHNYQVGCGKSPGCLWGAAPAKPECSTSAATSSPQEKLGSAH
jgi:hypothetical protein